MPIEGGPIAYKDGAYRAASLVREDGPIKPLKIPRGVNWRDVSIRIAHRNRLTILVKDQSLSVDREQLGLSSRDGKPTRAGEALEPFVESPAVDRDIYDNGILELNSVLVSLGVVGEPFDVTDISRDEKPLSSTTQYLRRWRRVFGLSDNRRR